MDSVGGLVYKLQANNSSFDRSMKLSGREMAAVKREMRKSRTDAEKLQDKVDMLDRALAQGAITSDEYHRSFVRLNSETDEAKRAQREHADAVNQAAAMTQRYKTDTERLADEIRELKRLKPHLDASTYARAVADINSRLPAQVAATEKLERTQARQQRRQELLGREMAEGRRIMQSVETEAEQYQREIDRLNKLLRRGAIDQQTFDRAARRAGQGMRNQRMEFASQLPVVGQFTGLLVSANPALAAIAVTSAIVAPALYGLQRAFDAVTDGVQRQMEAIDKQAKHARLLGADLQALQAIQYAAAQTAGFTEDQTNQALQRMARRVTEAAMGKGEAQEILQRMGLDARTLAQQDPTMMIRKIADAMKTLGGENEQLVAWFKLFDSEGAKLGLMLRDGSAGIDKYASKIEKLGAAINGLDAAQIESANDAIADAQMAIDGLYNTLAVKLSPEIELATHSIVSISKALHEWDGRILGIRTSLSGLAADWMDWSTRIEAYMNLDPVGIYNSFSTDRSAAMDQTVKFLENMNRIQAKQTEQEAAEHRRINRLIDQVAEEERLTQEKREQERLDRESDRLAKEQQRLQEQARREAERETERRQAEAQRRHDEVMRRGEQIRDANRTELEVYRDNLVELRALFRVGAIDQATLARASAAERERFRKSQAEKEPRSQPAATIRAGSREEYDAINRIMLARRDVEQRRHVEAQRLQELHAGFLERIAEAVEQFQLTEGV
ncbi:hypothetical protein V7x_28850 [Crateriforma conspicua]|uniref:Uncharacterized protein n=1 Tax=Crateriforma conspicua TaxID=2527996 RepID=A0A5C6FXU1_9PLAN|nr:hypothetical protein [Crateriforma conspicua]TWU67311.1 hypothetical protein V7x_28850 [Crateriforma conspicua]